MTGWLDRLHLDRSTLRFEFGVVVDVVPGVHNYRVSAGPRSFVYCSTASPDAAFGPSGVRPTHTIPPLTPVFFVRDPSAPDTGYIVSVQPHWSVHSGNLPADSIWPFTRTGLAVEEAHRYPIEAQVVTAQGLPNPMGSIEGADLSAGRPFDGTSVGEWGRITETGLAFHLDPFHAYVRVDESTGLFLFYEDQLTRLAGHNYQFVSSQEETEHLDDEGELYGHTRRSVFPWEAYGLWRFNQVTENWASATVTSNGLAGGQGQKLTNPFEAAAGTGYAVREPEVVGQLSAARLLDWSGYMGQGGLSVVAAPAQLDWAYPSVPEEAATVEVDFDGRADAPSGRLRVDGTSSPTTQPLAVPVNSYAGPHRPGLFEEHRGINGSYGIRSATRIVLAKRPSIPVAKPIRTPTDPYGDRPDSGYAASGLDGNDAAHLVQHDPTPTTDPGRRACLLPDAIAYMFNWEALHPFAYHERDWEVPQEGAAGADIDNQVAPDYSTLDSLDRLAAPAPAYLDVDHRYGLAEVYQNEAVIAILDDGSILLRDGWGSEVRMGGGNVELRAAGDVRLHTGRSVIAWGGYDVVLKAHNSVDVSAAQGDFRTKAARNSHHVTGASGYGGFHFESQSQCPAHNYTDPGQGAVSSGFVIRCPDSTVDVTAADVRVALDPGAPADGRITLDAGTSRAVYVRGKQVVNRVTANGAVVHLFDNGTGSLVGANEFAFDHTLLTADLSVDGKAFIVGCLAVDGWVTSSAHFASASASDKGGTVSQYSGSFDTAATAVTDRSDYLTGTFGADFDSQTLPAPNVEDAEFSFRTDAEYRSASFVYWRSHWEAIAEADGQTLVDWVEPELTGIVSGNPSRPHPGTRWAGSGGYAYQTYTFVDAANGWVAIDRDGNRSTYESGSPAAASSGTLASLYKVSVDDAVP